MRPVSSTFPLCPSPARLQDKQAHDELLPIIWGYKHVLWPNGHEVDRRAFSLPGWCRLCAMLLTDVDITLEDGLLHEGVGSA